MNFIKILLIVCTIFLGGFMIYGGIGKFAHPTPSATAQIEQYEKDGFEKAKESEHLKKDNHIFGMQQTGYFWAFLGICEIVFGLLIISQMFSFLGASMCLPITFNIFLFHVFLEADEVGELVLTLLLLLANLYILFYYYPSWKHLVKDQYALKFGKK